MQADFEGKIGHFMVTHPSKGTMLIDSITKQIVHADDREMADLAVELMAQLQEAASPYTVSHCGHAH